MSIIITGATGRYGGFALRHLLDRGAEPDGIIGCGRNLERLAELSALGVRTARVDHDDPHGLAGLVTRGDRVLLVPVSPGGDDLVAQNLGVVTAVAAAGGSVVYPSVARAIEVANAVTDAHGRTERALAGSGAAFTVLRNGWFSENYADLISRAAREGEFTTSAIPGRVASASVKDYAEAAAAVLAGVPDEGATIELAGDEAWSFPELAAMIARSAGSRVVARSVSFEEYRASLIAAGMPEPIADLTAGVEDSIRGGWLSNTDGTLSRLIGRPTAPIAAYVDAVVSAAG